MNPLETIGRRIGAGLGGSGKVKDINPLTGTIISVAAVALSRRFLPARFALVGAAIATGYVSRKLAQRAARLEDAETQMSPEPNAAANTGNERGKTASWPRSQTPSGPRD